MKTSKKMLIGFALVGFLSIIVGVIGIIGIVRLRNSQISMYEKQVVGLEYLSRASAAFKNMRITCRHAVNCSFNDDIKGAMDAKKQFDTHKDEFEYWMDELKKNADLKELDEFYDAIMALFWKESIPRTEKLIEKSINDIPDHLDRFKINVLVASLSEVNDRIERLIVGITELEEAIAKNTSAENAELTKLSIELQFLLLAMAIVIASAVTVYITRGITKPIAETADILNKISKGRFDARVTGIYKGEFALIKDSVNKMAEDLRLYMSDKIEAERTIYETELAKGRAEAAREAILDSINYASRIQTSLLPSGDAFNQAFSDYSILWKPRDIVGGDIYWLKNFNEGSVLCVCDCTGHGTPGALLTMLVASAFETIINENNYKDTANVIWELEQRIVTVLNAHTSGSRVKDGCDLAVLFIAKDGSVTTSAARTHIFVCDGIKVTQIKGQRLYIGEGRLKSKDEIKTITIPANADNKFYIASDGLYDQKGGGNNLPFGYGLFGQLILDNHDERQADIADKIWEAFEAHRGNEIRLDDFELISFKP